MTAWLFWVCFTGFAATFLLMLVRERMWRRRLLRRKQAEATAVAEVERLVDQVGHKARLLAGQLDVVKEDRERFHRRADAFFALIERIEQQRDEWREIHKSASLKHQNAVAMMEQALRHERIRNARVLEALNAYRADENKEPIRTPRQLDTELGIDAPPVGELKKYADELRRLYQKGNDFCCRRRDGADRPEDVDGLAERQRIVEELELAEP